MLVLVLFLKFFGPFLEVEKITRKFETAKHLTFFDGVYRTEIRR